jgi:hypothetical protein
MTLSQINGPSANGLRVDDVNQDLIINASSIVMVEPSYAIPDCLELPGKDLLTLGHEANRRGAFECASDRRRGTEAQGSSGAIEKSPYKLRKTYPA